MTGVERNADIVKLAAFAPVLTNVNNKMARHQGIATSLIAYDNHRCSFAMHLLSGADGNSASTLVQLT